MVVIVKRGIVSASFHLPRRKREREREREEIERMLSSSSDRRKIGRKISAVSLEN